MKTIIVLAAAAVLLALAASQAQADSGLWTFQLNPGYSMPVGDAANISRPGFMIEASGEYLFQSALSAGLELGYSSYKGGGTLFAHPFTSDVYDTILQATPFVRLSSSFKAAGATWRPYALAGAGVYAARAGSGTLDFGSLGEVSIPQGDWISHFGFNMGVGMAVDVGERFEFGVDLRSHDILTRQDINVIGSNNDVIQLLVPSARLGYKFGG